MTWIGFLAWCAGFWPGGLAMPGMGLRWQSDSTRRCGSCTRSNRPNGSSFSLLPLAPISAVAPERLPAVLTSVAERLRDEAEPGQKSTLWAATEILLGLYYPEDRLNELTREITTMVLGIRGIEESSVYQGILAKG